MQALYPGIVYLPEHYKKVLVIGVREIDCILFAHVVNDRNVT